MTYILMYTCTSHVCHIQAPWVPKKVHMYLGMHILGTSIGMDTIPVPGTLDNWLHVPK